MGPSGSEKTGVFGSIFLLAGTTLGAGILSIPFAVATTGWVLGGVSLLFVGVVTVFSLILLVQGGIASGAQTYEELGERAFPTWGKKAVSIAIMLGLFGALIAFLNILGALIPDAMDALIGEKIFIFKKTPVMILTTAVIVFPLSALPNIAFLDKTSFLAVVAIAFFAGIVIYEGTKQVMNGDVDLSHFKSIKLTTQFFQALPIISLAFGCQAVLFPMWKSMRNPTVKRVNLANLLGMGLCCVMYVVVGILAVFVYGDKTKSQTVCSNFFLNFSTKSTFYNIVRLIFAVAIMFHYPLVHFAFRVSVEEMFFSKARGYEPSYIRLLIETVVTVIITLILAIVIKDLDDIISVTGAVAMFPFAFLFPGIFYLKLYGYLGGPEAAARSSDEEQSLMKDNISINERGLDETLYEPKPSTMLAAVSAFTVVLFGIVWIISIVVSVKTFIADLSSTEICDGTIH